MELGASSVHFSNLSHKKQGEIPHLEYIEVLKSLKITKLINWYDQQTESPNKARPVIRQNRWWCDILKMMFGCFYELENPYTWILSKVYGINWTTNTKHTLHGEIWTHNPLKSCLNSSHSRRKICLKSRSLIWQCVFKP